MHLQQKTDYALRLLILLAMEPDRPVTVAEAARTYGLSEHHLAKIAQRLRDLGLVTTLRGRHGGMGLARAPEAIEVGEVVRGFEEGALVECFEPGGGACTIGRACVLKRAFAEAHARFLEVLDGYTLADLVARPAPLVRALHLTKRRSAP